MGMRAGRHVAPYIHSTAALVGTVPLTSDEHLLLRTPTHNAHEAAKAMAKQNKNHANYLISTKASRLGEASSAGIRKPPSSLLKNDKNNKNYKPEQEHDRPIAPNPLVYQGTQNIFEHF